MDLRQLRYFVAVAEELHFRRAAARLCISQPPLSQQIRRLEAELDTPLFLRTRRRVELTAAGQFLLERCRPLLAEADRLPHLVRQAAKGEIGIITIGYIASTSYTLLPAALPEFRRARPDVQVELRELSTRRQLEALANQTISLGLLRPPVNDPDIRLTPLLSERLVAVLPDTHPLAACDQIPLSSLATEPFVLTPPQLSPGYSHDILRACSQAGFTPRAAQEADEIQTIVNLVAAGAGVSLVPESVSPFERRGATYRPLSGTTVKLELALAHRADNRSPLINQFTTAIQTAALNTPGLKIDL